MIRKIRSNHGERSHLNRAHPRDGGQSQRRSPKKTFGKLPGIVRSGSGAKKKDGRGDRINRNRPAGSADFENVKLKRAYRSIPRAELSPKHQMRVDEERKQIHALSEDPESRSYESFSDMRCEDSRTQRSSENSLVLLPGVTESKDSGQMRGDYTSLWRAPELRARVLELEGIFCESGRGAAAFLKQLGVTRPLYVLPSKMSRKVAHALLDEVFGDDVSLDLQASTSSVSASSKTSRSKRSWGVISDAGLPGVADPGACLVRAGRSQGMVIESFPGVAAPTHAWMLCGIPAQRLYFEGYLPREAQERAQELKELELLSFRRKAAIAFMETPYRHEVAVESALEALDPATEFSVVQNIGCEHEWVYTARVKLWRERKPQLQKGPAIYLFKAASDN